MKGLENIWFSYVKEVVKQSQPSDTLTFYCMSVVWGLDCGCSCCSYNCSNYIRYFTCWAFTLFPRHIMQRHRGSSVEEPSIILCPTLHISDHPLQNMTSMWMTHAIF